MDTAVDDRCARRFSRMIAQPLNHKGARIEPASGFDFCVIDLMEHRDLLAIVRHRDEEAGHKRQAFFSVAASDGNVVSIYWNESKSRRYVERSVTFTSQTL